MKKILTPLQIFKSNKIRSDLRQYTRTFEKKFKDKVKLNVQPGSVYAAKYITDSNVITDKHHFTPVFASFGKFKNDSDRIHTRGINLLYLTIEQKIQLLEDFFTVNSKKPQDRVQHILHVHEKWLNLCPYAFKDYDDSRICNISEISSDEWGMIPLLQQHLFGNFNVTALISDFDIENKKKKIYNEKGLKMTKKEDKLEEDELDDEEESAFLEGTSYMLNDDDTE